MSNYTKTTNFATKDALASGNPAKIVKGTEIDTEFNNIAVASGTKANKASPVFTGTATLPVTNADSLSIGGDGVTVTGIKDEDDMASNSATKLASQQSIKAYVDSQVTAQDLDVTDGTTSISIDLDSEALSLLGGTGVTSTASGNGVTMAIDGTVATLTGTQTLTNKTLTTPVISGNLTTDGNIDGRDVATDGTKLDTVETNADVTDTVNVTAAGALMDSEVTNLAEVKAFDSSDYATAAQGTTADAALPKAGGAMTGAITTNSTFDGRDVATDGTKLDGIEALADVTDATNVTAAGALMDSELTSIASVKALDQGVATTDSPTFDGLTVDGTASVSASNAKIRLFETDTTDLNTQLQNQAGDFSISRLDDDAGSLTAHFNIDHATGNVSIPNGNLDVTGNIDLPDNGKLLLGASDDLQLYHNGNNSFITDTGAGSLYVRASDSLRIQTATNEEMIKAEADGAVTLYNNNAAKLATTSTGIDVTGTATMDGLNVSSSGDTIARITSADGNGAFLDLGDASDPDGGRIVYDSGSNLGFSTASTERMRIDSSGRVGIGTSSPSYKLSVVGNIGLTDGVSTASHALVGGNYYIQNTGAYSTIFQNNGAERMRIDSSGNVGIGTDSPNEKLQVDGNIRLGPAHTTRIGTDGTNAYFENFANGAVIFRNNGYIERMRIDSSGNVGIGTSSPFGRLSVDVVAGAPASSGNMTNGFTVHNSNGGRAIQLGVNETGAYNYLQSSYVNNANVAVDMAFFTGASERMRIDSSGNVGIGASSASGSRLRLDNGGTSGAPQLMLTATGASTQTEIRHDTSNNLIFDNWNSGRNERMRIDSSGNLLVGTTSGSSLINGTVDGAGFSSTGIVLGSRSHNFSGDFNRRASDGDIVRFRKDGTTVGSIGTINGDLNIGTGDAALRFNDSSNRIEPFNVTTNANTNGTVDLGVAGASFKDLYLSSKTLYQASGGNQHSIGADANDLIIRSETAGSETARFTYGGNLLVGKTSTALTTAGIALRDSGLGQFTVDGNPVLELNRETSSGTLVDIRQDGTTVGSISVSSSATTYNTSSDQRLKENIADADDAGSKIDAIQVRKYDWKADGSHQDYGMIAQELQTVAPEAVSGDADSKEMMGVDYSKLVPMLIKEIQSLRNRVASLEE